MPRVAPQTGRLAAPIAFAPSRPNSSPPATPAASGFRRLAALFAQPASGPAADPLAGMPGGKTRLSPSGSAAGAISRHQPAPVFPQAIAGETAVAPRFSVPRHVGEDAAAEAEMAELFARVLRREARRQGIADEGGAA